VALDIETGVRKWHFQTVHHGLWDYDLPAAPNLIDIREGNTSTPLLAQVTKQGFVFVLNRESGIPVWPIVETPVPQTTLTGERTSPTQPIPSKPLPFEHQGVNENNLIHFTESLRSQALDIVSEFDYGALYLPPTNKGAVAVPGIGGGASWSGAAYHPDKQILYVPSVTWPFVTRIERSGLQTIQNRDFINGPSGLPLMKPPYGRVTAINMKTGDHLWQSGVGSGFENNANIASMNLSGLGYPQRIFVVATENLLLTAQQTLSAFDLESGSKIAEVPLPSSALGSLMVYELNNKVYIVVPVGGDGIKSELIAYSLD
jgi:quinoprotein glucose dehydrogenase